MLGVTMDWEGFVAATVYVDGDYECIKVGRCGPSPKTARRRR